MPLSHDERRRLGGPINLVLVNFIGYDVEHHPQLEAGQIGADTEVGAAGAEGDVSIR